MVPLTIFTPTFNRAYCLHLGYEALKRQTSREFIWLIIDDGSTDHTCELVKKWADEKIVEIKYVYKENGGMHTAHNTAYQHIYTELNVCVDSDDYLTDDAVEKIVTFWRIDGNKKYGGITALDGTPDGKILGTRLPDKKAIKRFQNRVFGDKKEIYRTDLMKSYPLYPVFDGEKYGPITTKYILVDQDYEMLVLNEVICIVEYQNDGSSLNMIKQYKKNPKGFAEYRKVTMRYSTRFRDRFRHAIHYVSSCLIARELRFIAKAPSKIIVVLAIPFGVLLYVYITKTNRKTVIHKNLLGSR